jgi:hypothetical protein
MPRPSFCRKAKLAGDVEARAEMCYKKPVLRAIRRFFCVTTTTRLK